MRRFGDLDVTGLRPACNVIDTIAFTASPLPRSVPDSQEPVDEPLPERSRRRSTTVTRVRVFASGIACCSAFDGEPKAGRTPRQHQDQRIVRRLSQQRFERRAVDHKLRPAIEEAVGQIQLARVEDTSITLIDARPDHGSSSGCHRAPSCSTNRVSSGTSQSGIVGNSRIARQRQRRVVAVLEEPRHHARDRPRPRPREHVVDRRARRELPDGGVGRRRQQQLPALEARDRFTRRQPLERRGLAFIVFRDLAVRHARQEEPRVVAADLDLRRHPMRERHEVVAVMLHVGLFLELAHRGGAKRRFFGVAQVPEHCGAAASRRRRAIALVDAAARKHVRARP